MDFGAFARFGLVLVRPGALLLMAPGFGGQTVPMMTRVALTVMLAVSLAPVVTMPAGPDVGIALTIARESAIGLALGMTARALISGAELAGHLCSQQIGLSYAATIDPEGGARNTMLATLYGLTTVMTWLAINGHHLLLRALYASYEGLPIGGGGGVDASLLDAIRQVLGVVFVTGLRLASPVIAVLLLVELALGLISRTTPAINAMMAGHAIRFVVGVGVTALTFAAVPGLTRSLAERVIAIGASLASAFK
jgi:flagellar biosynthetic protein FliR